MTPPLLARTYDDYDYYGNYVVRVAAAVHLG